MIQKYNIQQVTSSIPAQTKSTSINFPNPDSTKYAFYELKIPHHRLKTDISKPIINISPLFIAVHKTDKSPPIRQTGDTSSDKARSLFLV